MNKKKKCTILILIAVTTLLNAIHALAAVTLISFTATPGNGQVLLKWETAIEIDNIGFNLYRISEGGVWDFDDPINDWLIPSDDWGSLIGADYEYTDSDVDNGTTYYYQLESVANDGSSEFVPGDLPNEEGYADPNDRIYWSDIPDDFAQWPVVADGAYPYVRSYLFLHRTHRTQVAKAHRSQSQMRVSAKSSATGMATPWVAVAPSPRGAKSA